MYNQLTNHYGFEFVPFVASCVAPFQYNRAANLCFWISDVKGNLTTAQQVCGSHGGSLATIDTVAKRDALLAYPNLSKRHRYLKNVIKSAVHAGKPFKFKCFYER